MMGVIILLEFELGFKTIPTVCLNSLICQRMSSGERTHEPKKCQFCLKCQIPKPYNYV